MAASPTRVRRLSSQNHSTGSQGRAEEATVRFSLDFLWIFSGFSSDFTVFAVVYDCFVTILRLFCD